MGTQTPTLEKLGLEYLQGKSLNDVLHILKLQCIDFANTSNIQSCIMQLIDHAHAYSLEIDNGLLIDIHDITNQFQTSPGLVLSTNDHVFIATKNQFQLRD